MLKGKKFSILLVAEGVMSGEQLQSKIKEITGLPTWVTVLGHIQRGGTPTAFDRSLAAHMGSEAVEALLNQKTGKMVTWNCHQIGLRDISDMLMMSPEFDQNSYDLAVRLSL